ncbi:4327_t:CDS:2 [Acaulospora colombiana]|uniref:4327_t:CDS:1 n=1 Tax=Acaulospora colombiana TaxID=27376 RepID=A0ACA9JYX0_9GLOM|nr:4327_t:CDS:2 [Acaulospora colombiana]
MSFSALEMKNDKFFLEKISDYRFSLSISLKMKGIPYDKGSGDGTTVGSLNVPKERNKDGVKKKSGGVKKKSGSVPLTPRQVNLYEAFNWSEFWKKKREPPPLQVPKNGKVPRCINAFMLMKTYVRKDAHEFASLEKKFDGVDISVVSGKAWSNSTEKDREIFDNMAKELKQQYKKAYPDQQYHAHRLPKWNNVSQDSYSEAVSKKQSAKDENKSKNSFLVSNIDNPMNDNNIFGSYNPNDPNEFFPAVQFLNDEDSLTQNDLLSGYQTNMCDD